VVEKMDALDQHNPENIWVILLILEFHETEEIKREIMI
jgi:hypothetical protein